MLVVGLWNFFNLLTAGAALGVCAERRQLERTPSLAIDRRGVLTLSGHSVDVSIERVSAEACTLRLLSRALDQGLTRPPLRGTLSVEPMGGTRRAAPLPVHLDQATRDGQELVMRVNFGTLAIRDYPALAGLMYGDAEAMRRFQLRRRRHKDIPTGTLQFAWWGLVEPFRALRYLLASRQPRPVAIEEAPVYDAPGGVIAQAPSVPGPVTAGAAPSLSTAAKPSDTESEDDWVRLMMDYENERTLAELRGRRTSAA